MLLYDQVCLDIFDHFCRYIWCKNRRNVLNIGNHPVYSRIWFCWEPSEHLDIWLWLWLWPNVLESYAATSTVYSVAVYGSGLIDLPHLKSLKIECSLTVPMIPSTTQMWQYFIYISSQDIDVFIIKSRMREFAKYLECAIKARTSKGGFSHNSDLGVVWLYTAKLGRSKLSCLPWSLKLEGSFVMLLARHDANFLKVSNVFYAIGHILTCSFQYI
jgi:hypothetical protein